MGLTINSFLPLIISFPFLFIASIIYFILIKININKKVISTLMGIFYFISFFIVIYVLFFEVLIFYKTKILLVPHMIEFYFGFIPFIDQFFMIDMAWSFLYRIFMPLLFFYYGVKFFVVETWRDVN